MSVSNDAGIFFVSVAAGVIGALAGVGGGPMKAGPAINGSGVVPVLLDQRTGPPAACRSDAARGTRVSTKLSEGRRTVNASVASPEQGAE